MSEENNRSKQPPATRGTFIERLVRKTLSSVGGIFERAPKDEAERLPSTSHLTERLKKLIDNGVRQQEDGSRIAPHLIHLKYTWGATQTEEFEKNLERLKNELLLVAIDHINDYRYRTVAPVKLEIKPDILTEGITLAVGYDASSIAQAEKVEVPVEIFAGLLPQENKPEQQKPTEIEVSVSVDLSDTEKRNFKLHFIPNGKANLTVGRNKDNDLFLDHASVSKLHASLVMSSEGKLRVADVGSTNGTNLDGERISYGKAYEITPDITVGFGEIKCRFEWDFEQFEAQAANEFRANEVFQNDGVQINVDSIETGEPETVFSKEPETVLGKTVDEPETVMKTSDEPETVMGGLLKQPQVYAENINSSDEPETVFRRPGKNADVEDLDPTMDFSVNKSDDENNNSSNRAD